MPVIRGGGGYSGAGTTGTNVASRNIAPFRALTPGTHSVSTFVVGDAWNPADAGTGIAFAEWNLRAEITGGWTGARGVNAKQGRVYFEYTIDAVGTDTCIGIANSAALFGYPGSNSSNSIVYFPSGDIRRAVR